MNSTALPSARSSITRSGSCRTTSIYGSRATTRRVPIKAAGALARRRCKHSLTPSHCEGKNDRGLNIITQRTDHLQKGTVCKIKFKVLHEIPAARATLAREKVVFPGSLLFPYLLGLPSRNLLEQFAHAVNGPNLDAPSVIQKFFVIGLFRIAFKRSRFVRPLGLDPKLMAAASFSRSWPPVQFEQSL